MVFQILINKCFYCGEINLDCITLLNSNVLSQGRGKLDLILSQSDQFRGFSRQRLHPSPCPRRWLQTFLSSLKIDKLSQIRRSILSQTWAYQYYHHPITFSGSWWEYMVQIEAPSTLECQEGVPAQGGQWREKHRDTFNVSGLTFQRTVGKSSVHWW